MLRIMRKIGIYEYMKSILTIDLLNVVFDEIRYFTAFFKIIYHITTYKIICV